MLNSLYATRVVTSNSSARVPGRRLRWRRRNNFATVPICLEGAGACWKLWTMEPPRTQSERTCRSPNALSAFCDQTQLRVKYCDVKDFHHFSPFGRGGNWHDTKFVGFPSVRPQ